LSASLTIDTSVLTLRLNELHHRLGDTVGAREQGKRAVAGDLRRTFDFAQDSYMDFVDRLDKTPGPEVMVTYMSRSKTKKIVDWKHTGRTIAEVRAFHLMLRSKATGRTPRMKVRDGQNIGVWKVERKMVVRESLFLRYLKEVQAHVGNMKAGWTAAAQMFGAKLPAYVTGKFNGNGYAISALTANKPSITISNSTKGIDRQMANAAKSAVRIRGEQLAKNIARMIKFGPGKREHYGY